MKRSEIKDYTTIAITRDTHRKVRLAATLAGIQIQEWVDRMAEMALKENNTIVLHPPQQAGQTTETQDTLS